MNTYLWIHRIKGPVMLLVFGVTALLNEWDIITFGRSWPLYLIAFGVLQLAERAAWSQAQQAQYAQGQYPPYGAVPGQAPVQGPPVGGSSTSLTVTPHDPEGR
jgi:hypothetical protein